MFAILLQKIKEDKENPKKKGWGKNIGAINCQFIIISGKKKKKEDQEKE